MKKHEKKLKEFQEFIEENYEEGMEQEDLSRLAQLFNRQHADGYFSNIDESDDSCAVFVSFQLNDRTKMPHGITPMDHSTTAYCKSSFLQPICNKPNNGLELL